MLIVAFPIKIAVVSTELVALIIVNFYLKRPFYRYISTPDCSWLHYSLRNRVLALLFGIVRLLLCEKKLISICFFQQALIMLNLHQHFLGRLAATTFSLNLCFYWQSSKVTTMSTNRRIFLHYVFAAAFSILELMK